MLNQAISQLHETHQPNPVTSACDNVPYFHSPIENAHNKKTQVVKFFVVLIKHTSAVLDLLCSNIANIFS